MNGAPCGHTGTHRCNGLTKCRLAIRNEVGQKLSDYLTDEELVRLSHINIRNDGSANPCSGCGETLTTELDFALHFTIPDMRFPGLGDCPNKPVNVHAQILGQ